MKRFRYLNKVTTLELDTSICIGCGMCVEVCPHQVFIIENDGARLQDIDACMECGACMRNCPVSALHVDAGVGCAIGLINEWLRSTKLSTTGGCCRS